MLAECPPAISQDAADLFAQLATLDFPVDHTADLTLMPAETPRDQVPRKKNELIDQAVAHGSQPGWADLSAASSVRASRTVGWPSPRRTATSSTTRSA